MSKSKIAWKDASKPPKCIYHEEDDELAELDYSELCLVKTDEGYALARWYGDVWLDEEHAETVNAIKYIEIDDD